MINIERYESITDLSHLRAAWNKLLSENDSNEVFLTFEWFQAWEATSFEKEKPLILIGTHDGNLAGIAPLAINKSKRKGVAYESVRFMGIGDYKDFIVHPEYKEEFVLQVIDYLKTNRHMWDAIELTNIPENSTSIEVLKRVGQKEAIDFKVAKDMVCPAMIIDGCTEFAESCLRKKSMVRHYNHFTKNGDLLFVNVKDPASISSHLEPFFEQHIKRRELAGGSSLFLTPDRREFYHRLVEFMPIEWLDFTVLKFNEAPIAYHFGFFYNKKLIWYKPSFDVNYAEHSPGEVLMHFLIQQAMEFRASEFDFTIGDEPFKRRFSNIVRYTYQVGYIGNKALNLYWISASRVKDALKKMRFIGNSMTE